MSIFFKMNQIDAVNLNAQALQNASDIVQRQIDVRGQERRRRGQQRRTPEQVEQGLVEATHPAGMLR